MGEVWFYWPGWLELEKHSFSKLLQIATLTLHLSMCKFVSYIYNIKIISLFYHYCSIWLSFISLQSWFLMNSKFCIMTAQS